MNKEEKGWDEYSDSEEDKNYEEEIQKDKDYEEEIQEECLRGKFSCNINDKDITIIAKINFQNNENSINFLFNQINNSNKKNLPSLTWINEEQKLFTFKNINTDKKILGTEDRFIVFADLIYIFIIENNDNKYEIIQFIKLSNNLIGYMFIQSNLTDPCSGLIIFTKDSEKKNGELIISFNKNKKIFIYKNLYFEFKDNYCATTNGYFANLNNKTVQFNEELFKTLKYLEIFQEVIFKKND